MKTLITLCLLAAVAAADAEEFDVPWDGSDPDTFITRKFLKEWPYDARCGLDKATWESVRGKVPLHHIRAVNVRPDVVRFAYDGDLPANIIEAVLRTRYFQWRVAAVGRLKTKLVLANAARASKFKKIDEAKRERAAAARAADIVYDRALALRALEDRYVELRARLADARIEHAVARARARAVAVLISKRKLEARSRGTHRLRELQAELAKVKAAHDAEHPRVQYLMFVIEQEKRKEPEATPELATRLMDLEIDQIAEEERLKQIDAAIRDLVARRVQLIERPDLKSLELRVAALAGEYERDAAGSIRAAIKRLNSREPRRR